MKEILFCGSFIPSEINEKIKYNSSAANNFQKELIINLSKQYKIDILTYVGYYEKNINLVIESFKKNNIYYAIKQENKNYVFLFYRYYKLFNQLIQNKKVVILYNYNYINMFINYFCKKRKIKTVLIVADHSEYYEYRNPIRRFLAYRYSRDYYKFDYLIFLSRELKERYNFKNSLLMIGGINIGRFKDFVSTPKKGKMVILYSGILSKVTGIDIYLKAIKLIEDKDIRFVFSGKGEMKELLIEKSREDKRIKYVGFLNEEAYLSLLGKANILINPRNMDLPQNKNNFPSKILEYLATGKVIISTKFPNYQEFEENMFFCDTNAQSIADKIKFIAKNYNNMYKNQYVINREEALKYDWSIQSKKIEQLIEG